VPSSGSDAMLIRSRKLRTHRSAVPWSATLRFRQINVACSRVVRTCLALLLDCSACGLDLQCKQSHLATVTPVITGTITSHSTTIPFLVKCVCVCVCVYLLHTLLRFSWIAIHLHSCIRNAFFCFSSLRNELRHLLLRNRLRTETWSRYKEIRYPSCPPAAWHIVRKQCWWLRWYFLWRRDVNLQINTAWKYERYTHIYHNLTVYYSNQQHVAVCCFIALWHVHLHLCVL